MPRTFWTMILTRMIPDRGLCDDEHSRNKIIRKIITGGLDSHAEIGHT